jgi:excinuclease UvrABC nuclease subunit
MADTIQWPGISGKSYKYWIHPLGTSFKDEPGNYIFAKKNASGKWVPVYIGQTKSLRDRLSNHNEEPCAKKHGATHIHTHTSGAEDERLVEESDLVKKWSPPCNG